jgi:hypothetical protein
MALALPPMEQRFRYTFAEVVEMRRQVLRYARSMPPGSNRNQHRRIAMSLRRLFKNEQWRLTHII